MTHRIYLLDTNVCIDLLRMQADGIPASVGKLSRESVILSSIVLAELETGVRKSARPEFHSKRLKFLTDHLTVAPFDAKAARDYGEIRTHLERTGNPIGPLDMLIAAHAVSLSAVIVTGNLREFKRVPNLDCLSWKPRKR